ncbi:hypothetical protein QQX98_009258 [Neonectria punicea]|uniref:Uncharacterized protein n=1 Tax=Neonectria punicea TaxID=979145 RepID=A0ABR1GSU1_9HYPO
MALLQTLRNVVRDSDATRDFPVLQSLIRDLCQENPAEEDQPFVQRHDNFYQRIRHRQGSLSSQCPIPSAEGVQAAAKAQDMLHLRMLNDMGGSVQGSTNSIGNADIDDLLVRQCNTKVPIRDNWKIRPYKIHECLLTWVPPEEQGEASRAIEFTTIEKLFDEINCTTGDMLLVRRE